MPPDAGVQEQTRLRIPTVTASQAMDVSGMKQSYGWDVLRVVGKEHTPEPIEEAFQEGFLEKVTKPRSKE